MNKTARKFLSLCVTAAMVTGMAATAFAAETKTYTLDSYGDGDLTMTVTNVDSDTVSGKIGNAGQSPTIKISTESTITYDFATYGVTVRDEKSDLLPEGETVVKISNDKALSENEEGPNKYEKGYTIQFTKAGKYMVAYASDGNNWNCPVLFEVAEKTADTSADTDKPEADPAVPATPLQPAEKPVIAAATASKVLVNGTETDFEAYNINDNNYFKLRDVAKAVSGSEKQFEVTWDGAKNAINLVSNQAYTVTGGELVKGDGTAKNAVPSTATIYKDGEVIELKAYTINDNNYFMLRDIGRAFNFSVVWDNAVVVDTTKEYTE